MRHPGKYILIDGVPTPCADLEAWGWWFETHDRVLARDEIGAVCVSTIFLGLDHNFGFDGPPVLWETMIFGGDLDGEGRRYVSAAAARAGHAELVAAVLQKLSQ